MKNLKRVLSLGLASVMLLGMMVVGASAKDFTDAEDIVHTEAVQTMVALKIINGKEDGSFFAPKDNVTRGEMAKMIAVLMNGGSEANTGVKTTPTFTDIGGHWAEGWIEYCADMAIINGRGDGTFDPNGQVTGVEALKMVLTALGYNADAYGLVGAGWAAQTIERARATAPVKLVEELSDVVMTAPATRDVAAQMIWNGLQANTVTTRPDQNKSNGEIIWSYDTTNTSSLLKQRYDADIVKGEYKSNYDMDNSSCDKGEIAVFDGTKTHKVPSDLSIDNIGEEIKIVYRDSSTKGTKGQADAKDTIYGVFNTGATRVVKSQLSKVKDNNTKDHTINIDGTVYKVADSKSNNGKGPAVQVHTNFIKTTAKYTDTQLEGAAPEGGKEGTNSKLTTDLKQQSSDTIKITFNDDNEVENIYLTENYVSVVTAINATKINVSSFGSLTIADHDVEDGLKVGDIVIVTPRYGTSKSAVDGVVSVAKAEKVAGEVASYTDNNGITLDNGKTYKVNYKNPKTIQGLLQSDPTSGKIDGTVINDVKAANEESTPLIGEDVELYLSNGYVMAVVKTSESASNYSVVTEVKPNIDQTGGVFASLQLQVMGADGTKEIITVSKDSKTGGVKKTTSNDYNVGDIVTYSFNDDNEAEVVIRDSSAKGALTYNDNTKSVNGTATTADCVLFVNTNSTSIAAGANIATEANWNVYNIRDLDGFTASNKLKAVATNSDGKVVAAVIDLGADPDGATDDTVYGIVSSDPVYGADKYYSFNIQSNGETYSVRSRDKISKRTLVSFKPTADNKYAAGKIDQYKGDGDFKGVYVDLYSAEDSTLAFFGSATLSGDKYVGADKDIYALDKDCVIVYVDANGATSDGVGNIPAFDEFTGLKNAAIKTKTVTENDVEEYVITVIFAEVGGARDIWAKNNK